MNDLFWTKLKEIYIKEDGNDSAYQTELPKLQEIFKILEKKLEGIYLIELPVGRGGSGIVVKILDTRLNINRAIKIPRPIKDELLESVKNEIKHLNEIKHENIINIYTLGEIEIQGFSSAYPYFVMDYIEEASDIKKSIQKQLAASVESKNLRRITQWLLDKFYITALALKYCHDKKIIHFDIKPSNILLDINEKPIMSDLGFAKKKSDDNTPSIIGFTIFYAHNDLKEEYLRMSSRNRVRKPIAPKDFKEIWDIYAFGKSILEMLALIEQQFPDGVLYDYIFTYLHLSACRMLDGRNLREDETERYRKKLKEEGEDLRVFKEIWLELESVNFEDIKYTSIDQVILDFEKLKFNLSYSSNIPELDIFYNKRIQSSDGIPAPFSTRVKLITEHPVFARLARILQLGLINNIYPSATHTRLEHSIGVFRNCCLYVSSLYNDPYNPLFKQLVTENDIKAVLVASLLHDLGQYPLAHEIEENNREIRHEGITIELLDNETKDRHGNTLKNIIENNEWGWGINIESVKEMLTVDFEQTLFKNKSLKVKMLSSLINGPIDADKLDYLIRDSKKCHLKYGEIVDIDRLIRNLTIVITKNENGDLTFSLGTYEKGQSAAESLTFARYLLYQSLYWHHTARSIRVMLRTAIITAIQKTKGKGEPFINRLRKLVANKTEIKHLTNEDILNFIEDLSDKEGKELIKLIKERNYYKRILTIHFEKDDDSPKSKLLPRFREAAKKINFNEKLQLKIKEDYANYINHVNQPLISQLNPEITSNTLELLSKPNQILCDAPSPSFGVEDELLCFIPEPERLQKNYYSRKDAGSRVSDVWNNVYFTLMQIATKGRIFCNPLIRDNIMATLGPDGVKKALIQVIKETI